MSLPTVVPVNEFESSAARSWIDARKPGTSVKDIHSAAHVLGTATESAIHAIRNHFRDLLRPRVAGEAC